MEPSPMPNLGRYWPSLLSVDSGPSRKRPDEIIGDSDGPEHLPQRPMQPRGVRGSYGVHVGRVMGVRRLAALPAPTRMMYGWKQFSRANTSKAEKCVEVWTGA